MKYLYIVDYWVPFPQSEYGGMITLIAEDDTEAFTLLSDEEHLDSGNKHIDKLMPNIINAQKFQLVEEYESIILEAFIT